jgi:hypothetical protein
LETVRFLSAWFIHTLPASVFSIVNLLLVANWAEQEILSKESQLAVCFRSFPSLSIGSFPISLCFLGGVGMGELDGHQINEYSDDEVRFMT